MICSGLILAAGASSRMGQPKALLLYEGETFLDRLTGILESRCAEVIAVTGFHGEAIRAGLKRRPTLVTNPQPERGQLSSLKCGLRALPDNAEAFLFVPVDYPAVRKETVERLVDALDASADAVLAIPRFEGRHGHPVACRRPMARELLELTDKDSARDVVRSHKLETIYIDVADAGVVTDVDDPAAYQRLLALADPS